MGKKATKAADNIYCIARYQAAEQNKALSSRESAAEVVGIDRTRLARLELGTAMPYPEEVLAMSKAYEMPELCNEYCSRQCPIGKLTMKPVGTGDLDRMVMKLLATTKEVGDIRENLIEIAADGVIDEQEKPEFAKILRALEEISDDVQALKLWARKNIEIE